MCVDLHLGVGVGGEQKSRWSEIVLFRSLRSRTLQLCLHYFLLTIVTYRNVWLCCKLWPRLQVHVGKVAVSWKAESMHFLLDVGSDFQRLQPLISAYLCDLPRKVTLVAAPPAHRLGRLTLGNLRALDNLLLPFHVFFSLLLLLLAFI